MQTITIGPNDAGQRLDKFLSKAFPRMPMSLMYKYIRIKRIKLNSKRCAIADRLNEGDVLSLYITDELLGAQPQQNDFLRAPKELQIVYEDNNILLADKPAGLVVHESDSELYDTLINRIKHYLFDKGEYHPDSELSFSPALCNRIDRNTGGIVIAAKNAPSLRILNEKIKNREITKKYLLVLHGTLDKKRGTLRSILEKDEKTNKVFIKKDRAENGKTAVTNYKVLSERGGFSLIEAELITGRTHQIRAQFAEIGHPLAGDTKYGKPLQIGGTTYRWQMLHSHSLTFDFATDAGMLNYLNGKTYTSDHIWFLDEFFNHL